MEVLHMKNFKIKLLLIVMLGITQNLIPASQTSQMVSAHIFVHGTRFSGLAFVSALPFLQNTLKDSHLYVLAIRKSRSDRRLFDSQVMQESGLIQIPESVIKQCRTRRLSPELSRRAAIHVASGYDMLMVPKNDINLYYTLGWDGLLQDIHRREAAGALYTTIVDLRKTLEQKYPGKIIRIILHGHSHGGNLILYLAYHENEKKQNLIIDCACLYGTPIQAETASYAQHDMFKTIISYYSHGDSIQVADKLSTESGTSERCLSKFINIKNLSTKKIIDIGLRINGDERALNHASYFFIDMYSLAGKLSAPLTVISPFPIVTFAPVMMQLIDQFWTKYPTCSNACLDFSIENENSLCLWLVDQQGRHVRSTNILPRIKPAKNMLEETWRPFAFYGAANVTKLALSGLANAIPDYIRQNIQIG